MFDLKYLKYLGNEAQTKWRDLALANLLLEVNILSILSVYKHVNHNHLNLGIYNILSLLQIWICESADERAGIELGF